MALQSGGKPAALQTLRDILKRLELLVQELPERLPQTAVATLLHQLRFLDLTWRSGARRSRSVFCVLEDLALVVPNHHPIGVPAQHIFGIHRDFAAAAGRVGAKVVWLRKYSRAAALLAVTSL